MRRSLRGIRNRLQLARDVVRLPQAPTADVVDETDYYFNLDTPSKHIFGKRDVVVSGWLVPTGNRSVRAIRAVNNGRQLKLFYGAKRQDVSGAFPAIEHSKSLNSGFWRRIKIETGSLSIEVDLGSGFQVVYSESIVYSEEKLVDVVLNNNLSNNWAEHQNLLENNSRYYHEKDLDQVYQRHPSDPRLVAFYLPQFHPIPENDAHWGKGFTEWRNVAAAQPRFVGHQQPILPGELGFYDLRLESTIADQIELAKKHGIYGFCFYYYWFSGKRLLEKPLDSFLKNSQWDFNFTICWANENWTKRWDGLDKDVIIAQQYRADDPLKFIKDVEHILLDPRYIRENGKPVLSVYRASELKDVKNYASIWRDYFRKQHHLELQLVSMLGFDTVDPRTYGFDAGLDFAPLTTFFKASSFENGKYPFLDVSDRLLDVNFDGSAADYRKIALNQNKHTAFQFPTYSSVMPSWDNDARKKGKGAAFIHNSPDIYAHWLDDTLKHESRRKKSPIVFINAWNEWAEGAMLEPTQHYGHAVLNRTTEVLAKHSLNSNNAERLTPYRITRDPGTELAVIIHVFYADEWKYIQKRLKNIGSIPYDLFITITQKDAGLIHKIRKQYPAARINIVPNRGRDVLPFIHQATKARAAGYKYFLKLHTKRSNHRTDGQAWFEELIDNLLPSVDGVDKINRKLTNGASLIGPAGHWVSLGNYIGSNRPMIAQLLRKMHGPRVEQKVLASIEDFGYFAGTMLWGSFALLDQLLDIYLLPEDFESERGQIDGTMAHALERLLGLLPYLQSSDGIYQTSSSLEFKVQQGDQDTDYRYAA